jgi:hypothetical protein
MLNKNREPTLLLQSSQEQEIAEPAFLSELAHEFMCFAGTANIEAIDLLLNCLSPHQQSLLWDITKTQLNHPKGEALPSYTWDEEVPLHTEELPLSVFGSNLSLMIEEILYFLKKMPHYTADSLNIARSDIFSLIKERKAESQGTNQEEVDLTASEEALVHKVVEFFARQVLIYKKSGEEATNIVLSRSNSRSPIL